MCDTPDILGMTCVGSDDDSVTADDGKGEECICILHYYLLEKTITQAGRLVLLYSSTATLLVLLTNSVGSDYSI